jgi:ribosomal protein S16
MNPQRIAIKFFVKPDPRATIDLEPFIPMFHRFIQKGSVEGLLIDVADYAHVRDGPGVILIGHDVDYGIDTTGGRAGLLVTRKRCGDLPLSEAVRDTLRKALIAIRAIEADGSGGLGFATDVFDLQLLDRLATPNDEESYARVCAEVVPVVEKLWGDAGAELTRARARDARTLLAVTIAVPEGRGVGAVLEALGGAPPVRAEKQKEWELEVEELKRLLSSGADFVLIRGGLRERLEPAGRHPCLDRADRPESREVLTPPEERRPWATPSACSVPWLRSMPPTPATRTACACGANRGPRSWPTPS